MFLKTDLRLKTSHLDLRAVNDLDELSPCSQLLELALNKMKFNLIQTLLPLVGGLLNVVSSNPILSCGSIGGALTILEGK